MTFEEFLKIKSSERYLQESTSIPTTIKYALSEPQIIERRKDTWQEELQRWKNPFYNTDFYVSARDEEDDGWGITRNSIWVTSSPYRKEPMYFYADESHMSDFGEKIEITIDKKRIENNIVMSFDDVMGFGGADGK